MACNLKGWILWCYWKRQTHVLAFLNPYTILYLSTVSWWPLHDLWKTLFLHELWINPNRNVKRLSNLLINSHFLHLRGVIYAIAWFDKSKIVYIYVLKICNLIFANDIHKISQYFVQYWYKKIRLISENQASWSWKLVFESK